MSRVCLTELVCTAREPAAKKGHTYEVAAAGSFALQAIGCLVVICIKEADVSLLSQTFNLV